LDVKCVPDLTQFQSPQFSGELLPTSYYQKKIRTRKTCQMEVFPDNFTTRWCICAQQKVLQQETISLMINNVVGFDSSASKTAVLPFEQHLSWQNVWSNPM